jgi:transcriptional regulator with XRE-family HTH domain
VTPTLGTRLRELRNARRLTQRELAARVGADYTYISKLENDRTERPPSEGLICNLAEHLGVAADELLLLAQRVPSDVEASIIRRPDHVELLRSAEKLTPEEYREFMRDIQKRIEGR